MKSINNRLDKLEFQIQIDKPNEAVLALVDEYGIDIQQWVIVLPDESQKLLSTDDFAELGKLNKKMYLKSLWDAL